MPDDSRGLYRLGGAAFIGSGLLFLSRGIIDVTAGAPPSNGAEILAWIASHSLVLKLDSEILFFAAVLLVPGVIALYQSLAAEHRGKAAAGCGIIGVAIAVLSVSLVVHGRLVYPVYGIRASTPDLAALVLGLFYGGMHAVMLLLGVATFILSLAMMGGAYGKAVAYPGFVTAVVDVAGSYPDLIGPGLTLVSQLFLSAWFIAVGARLYGMREPVHAHQAANQQPS